MDIETTDEVLEKAVVAGLNGLDFITSYSTAEIAEAFNGIGPSFLSDEQRKKLSKYLALFMSAALIHDMRYTYSDGSRYGFNFANFEFRDNCYALATHAYGFFNWHRYRACFVAWLLFKAVASEVGWLIWREAARKAGKRTNGTYGTTGTEAAAHLHPLFRTTSSKNTCRNTMGQTRQIRNPSP